MENIHTCFNLQDGAAVMIGSATIVGVIDRSEAMGLLTRQADANDRRVNPLQLTARGRSARPAMQATMDQLNAKVDLALGQSAESVRESLRKLAMLPIKQKV